MKEIFARYNRIHIWQIALSIFFIGLFLYDFFSYPALLHWENYIYHNYLAVDEIPPFNNEKFLLKIFNVCSIDACIARFRPLGHLATMLDAKFIFFSNLYINYGFHSIVHFFSMVISVLLVYKIIRYSKPSVSRSTTLLLSAYILISSAVLMNSSTVFRPVKSVTAMVVLIMYYFFISSNIHYSVFLKEFQKNNIFKICIIFGKVIFFSCLCLVDEQVGLFLFLFLLAAGILFIFFKRGMEFVLTFGLVAISYVVMQKYIAPITYVWFTSPQIQKDFSDPFSFLVLDFNLLIKSLENLGFQTLSLVGGFAHRSFGFHLGVVCVIFLSILFLYRSLYHKIESETSKVNLLFSTLVFLGSWVMTYVLGLRHPPIITDIGVIRSSFYSLPAIFVCFLFALNLLSIDNFSVINRRVVMIVLFLFSMDSFFQVTRTRNLDIPSYKNFSTGPLDGWVESQVVRGVLLRELNLSEYYNRLSPAGKSYIDIILQYLDREMELPPVTDRWYKEKISARKLLFQ